ncbi:MAG: LacI family DNA-binding transcriptional regulator [Luteolibacter sp.]
MAHKTTTALSAETVQVFLQDGGWFDTLSSMAGNRITLKDIADATDLSLAAVSMAMRNHREISESTRNKVQAMAEKLGYKPDPAMRALADYRTRRRSAGRRWDRVALLHDWPSAEAFHQHPFYCNWHERLSALADARGIVVEAHWLGNGGTQTRAVFRQLHHRGITGVLVAPPAITVEPREVDLPRDRFQVVTFGPEHLYRDFHTVQFDFYENLRLAWSKLRAKGHRRIGLVYQELQGWRTGQAWRAAFHIEKLEAGWKPGEMMPLMFPGIGERGDPAAYYSWLRRDGYDAVISSMYEVEEWNRHLEDPPDLAVFHAHKPGQQGIDLNVDQLLRSAFELLCVEMQHALIERQDLPFRLHIPGRWVDGSQSCEVCQPHQAGHSTDP